MNVHYHSRNLIKEEVTHVLYLCWFETEQNSLHCVVMREAESHGAIIVDDRFGSGITKKEIHLLFGV